MSAQAFLTVLTVGAALIALWTDQRFPGLTPRGLTSGLICVGAAGVVLAVLGPVATDILDARTPGRVLAAIFVVTLPALTFAFLSALWMVKLALRSLGGKFP